MKIKSKTTIIMTFFIILLTVNGIETVISFSFDPGDPSDPPPADTIRPTVTVYPNEGTTVYDEILISATAYDNVGIKKVSFYFDGAYIGYDSSSPYRRTLDTTKYQNGVHSIRATAMDTSGNIRSDTNNIYVQNSPISLSGIVVDELGHALMGVLLNVKQVSNGKLLASIYSNQYGSFASTIMVSPYFYEAIVIESDILIDIYYTKTVQADSSYTGIEISSNGYYMDEYQTYYWPDVLTGVIDFSQGDIDWTAAYSSALYISETGQISNPNPSISLDFDIRSLLVIDHKAITWTYSNPAGTSFRGAQVSNVLMSWRVKDPNGNYLSIHDIRVLDNSACKTNAKKLNYDEPAVDSEYLIKLASKAIELILKAYGGASPAFKCAVGLISAVFPGLFYESIPSGYRKNVFWVERDNGAENSQEMELFTKPTYQIFPTEKYVFPYSVYEDESRAVLSVSNDINIRLPPGSPYGTYYIEVDYEISFRSFYLAWFFDFIRTENNVFSTITHSQTIPVEYVP